MKTTMKFFLAVTMLTFCFSFTPELSRTSNRCPLIQLSSPPSTLLVGVVRPACVQTLTVNTTNCTPFTFTFTWGGLTPGTFVKSTASGSGVLTFNSINLGGAAPGTTISLVITDCCGGSSVTYNFTAVAC